jgi:tetratricopeptide (TPR) repeat protein
VQAVLATRLAQISDPARQLAEVAATIGRGFTISLLQQAGDVGEEDLALALDELWRRRIVRERGLDAYDFGHDKLREAAYASLSPARRRLLHQRTAQALEAIHASDLDPVSRQVAAHYRRAGLPAQAIPYYLRAGHEASRIHAQQEAIAAFERGLDLLQGGSWDASQSAWRSQMAAQGYESLGDVLAQLGPEEARSAYQAALQEIPPEDLLARARLHRKIGMTWWPQSEHEKALQAVRRALSTLGPEPSTPDAEWWSEWASVQTLRAEVCYYSARVEELEETIEEMERAIEHLTTPAQQFRLSWAIGAARLRRGRYVVSDWFITAEKPAMVAAIRQSGDPEATTFVLYMLGWVTLLYGDLDEAEQDMQEALALAERTRHLVYRTWILTWLSVLHRKRGEAGATREYALRGLPVAMQAGLLENAALVRGNLAWIAWREGDLAEAEKQARTALELWDQSAFVYAFHWTALFPLLVMAVERGALDEALGHARALLHPQQQRLPDSLEAALEAAIQAGKDGDAKAAREDLERAVQAAKETGYL